MAFGFGATEGVNSADRVVTGYIGQSPQRTFAFRCKYNSSGGGGFGRVISTDGLAEYIATISGLITFSRQWSGTQYQWGINGTGTAGATYSVVVSYDSSSAANNPTAYVNGAQATLTSPAARTGTPDTDVNSYKIGNRADGTRNWDGWISSVAIWNEIIPPSVALAISDRYSPLIWRQNLVYYNPLIRDAVDLVGGLPQTLGGTAVVTHPPVQLERGGGFVDLTNYLRPKTQRLICEGGSSVAGFGLTDPRSQSLPAQAGVLLGSGWEVINLGITGSGFLQMQNTTPRTTYWRRNPSLNQDIVFCFAGGNDIAAGQTGAQAWTLCQNWAAGIKALGYKLIIGTIFAQNRGATWDAERQSFNTLLRNSSGVCDAVADFASDPNIDQIADTSNATYYQGDAWHLTERGLRECLLPYLMNGIRSIT